MATWSNTWSRDDGNDARNSLLSHLHDGDRVLVLRDSDGSLGAIPDAARLGDDGTWRVKNVPLTDDAVMLIHLFDAEASRDLPTTASLNKARRLLAGPGNGPVTISREVLAELCDDLERLLIESRTRSGGDADAAQADGER